MQTTSILFGSYASRYPRTLTSGLQVDPRIFWEGAQSLEHFEEPEAAVRLRKHIWGEAVNKKFEELSAQGGIIYRGRINGMAAVIEEKDGIMTPVMFAGPLYTVKDPTEPSFCYHTDWSYFQATQKREYIDALQQEMDESSVPLMVGMHVESPKVPWIERPSTVQGRPGEKHPPSTSMSHSSLHYVAQQRLFTPERLGQLGLQNYRFSDVMNACKIVLGQRSTFEPPSNNTPHPYLADYRFIFE